MNQEKNLLLVNISDLIKRKEYDKAEIACKEQLKTSPNDAGVLIKLSCVYYEKENYKECGKLLERIVKECPNLPSDLMFNLYFHLAECFSREMRYNEAQKIYKIIDLIKPNDPNVMTGMGITYIHLREYDLALQYFDLSSKLDANNEKLLFAKGYLFEKIRRLEEALALYSEALLVNPKHSNALTNQNRLTKRFNLINEWKVSKEEAPIVMVGNSHFEYAEWNSMFPDKKIANRGIGGDCITDILRRMDSILNLKSQKAFVQVGLGDFNDLNLSVEEVFLNYKKMVGILHENIDDVYILSTIKIHPEKMGGDSAKLNDYIDNLNTKLNSLASPKIHTVNINNNLCNMAGLREELTDDGVHLNLKGYYILQNQISNLI